jgi:dihydroorotate dehydrogenase (fumarate)
VYRHGFDAIGSLLNEMRQWMDEKQYHSVEQLKGSMSQENCPDPAAFERGNYMKALTSFTGMPI